MHVKYSIQFLLRLACFLAIIRWWTWQMENVFPRVISLFLLIGGVLLSFLLCYAGRRLLDARPSVERAVRNP